MVRTKTLENNLISNCRIEESSCAIKKRFYVISLCCDVKIISNKVELKARKDLPKIADFRRIIRREFSHIRHYQRDFPDSLDQKFQYFLK